MIVNHHNAGTGNGRYSHGQSRSKLNAVFRTMLWRCRKHPRWAGRGIRVCKRWAHPTLGFQRFVADMGPRPPGTSLERKRNSGMYSPGNCVWATPKTQSRNTRRNRMILFRGKRMCMSAWADEIGISRKTLQDRLARGWSKERALTTKT